MQLRINLATKTYINFRQLNFFVAAAVLLLFLMLFLNVRDIATNAGEMKRVAKETAKFTGGKVVVVPEKEYQALLDQIRFANGIIEKKTFNWLMLLDRLERVVPDGIALTAIEPDPKGDSLKLAGAARNFGYLQRFMENLENSQSFTQIFLVNQAEAKVGETQKGVNFSITCKAGLK